jgi:Holliday junction resolvase RusA-like endonuclease
LGDRIQENHRLKNAIAFPKTAQETSVKNIYGIQERADAHIRATINRSPKYPFPEQELAKNGRSLRPEPGNGPADRHGVRAWPEDPGAARPAVDGDGCTDRLRRSRWNAGGQHTPLPMQSVFRSQPSRTEEVLYLFTLSTETKAQMKPYTFTLSGAIKPYVRMTQRSQWKDRQALEYKISQVALKVQFRNQMSLLGVDPLPEHTPLSLELDFVVSQNLHTKDIDNMTKAVIDAAQRIVFRNDCWIDRVTVSRRLGDQDIANVTFAVLAE